MKRKTAYTAPIPNRVVRALREYRRALSEEEDGIQRLSPDRTVFGIKVVFSIKTAFTSAVRRAKLPHPITFHDLRRIHLNRLRQRGVSLETTMALTDHRSVATVLKYYRLVPEEDLRKGVEALESPEPKRTK